MSDKLIEIDLNFDPLHNCPFHEEELDQTACGDGTGYCRISEPDSAGFPEVVCPALGPRGGNTRRAPDNCPLRKGRVMVRMLEESEWA